MIVGASANGASANLVRPHPIDHLIKEFSQLLDSPGKPTCPSALAVAEMRGPIDRRQFGYIWVVIAASAARWSRSRQEMVKMERLDN